MPGKLHGQVTGEAAGVLDPDHADAVGLAVGEQGGKAGTLGHGIGAGHCSTHLCMFCSSRVSNKARSGPFASYGLPKGLAEGSPMKPPPIPLPRRGSMARARIQFCQ
jgi:hypothetical protein